MLFGGGCEPRALRVAILCRRAEAKGRLQLDRLALADLDHAWEIESEPGTWGAPATSCRALLARCPLHIKLGEFEHAVRDLKKAYAVVGGDADGRRACDGLQRLVRAQKAQHAEFAKTAMTNLKKNPLVFEKAPASAKPAKPRVYGTGDE
jgi:hypothetical protein